MTRDFYMNHVRKGTQNIKRFGMEDVLKPQNLADHGYQVMNLFLIACDFMAYNPTVKELDKVLNHDVVETLTGDLNKLVKEKNLITRKAWEDIEKELTDIIPDPIGMYQDNWDPREYRHGKDWYQQVETFGELWKFCDAMDAYLYCMEERKRGNTNLQRAEFYYFDKLKLMNHDLMEYIVHGN